MSEVFYYIKNGENITGPFPAGQLRDMIQNNILPSSIMISENRIYWNSAAKILLNEKDETTQTVTFKLPPEKQVVKAQTAVEIIPENPPAPILPAEEPALQETVKDDSAEQDSLQDKCIIIPNPIYATFSMLYNAPSYLKNMHASIKYDYTFPTEPKSSAAQFSLLTVCGCIFIEFVAIFFMMFSMISDKALSFMTCSIMAIMVMGLLLILENICFSAAAKQKKLFDRFVLLMQMQLSSFYAFMVGMVLFAVRETSLKALPLYLQIITILFVLAVSAAGMINMGTGMYYAAKNLFKFKMAGRIAAIAVTELQWILFLVAVANFSHSLSSFF